MRFRRFQISPKVPKNEETEYAMGADRGVYVCVLMAIVVMEMETDTLWKLSV